VRVISIFILSFTPFWLFGQETSIEELRAQGYQARIEGKYTQALEYYEAILKKDANDYDANLATARLYAAKENYDRSMAIYQRLLDHDPLDWEALHGIGNCHLQLGNPDQAIIYHRRAINTLPDYVPGYLALAKALSWQGSLDEAILIYKKANIQDSTYSEVWAGIGKMYYWKGEPFTALTFYQKALALDSTNTSIRAEYQQIQQGLKLGFSSQFRSFQEKEQSYEINALIQRYIFSKRLSNHFHLQVNTLFDYANRDFTEVGIDTTRWFINTWAKASWIGEHHRLGLYLGYSASDQRWSTYGLDWQMQYKWGAFSLTNTITAGYEYFFYWNSVGRNLAGESLRLGWKKWEAVMGVSFGRVDEKLIRRYSDQEFLPGTNPFLIYQIGFNYQILKNPIVKIGGRYSLMDFEFQSPDYYSPYERRLYGLALSAQKKFKYWYFYTSFNYNPGTETFYFLSDQPNIEYESGKIVVNNWSASAEIGYTKPSFSLSAGGSRFQNPFYKNRIVFFALSKSF
jgi:Flp pilus assembly protein TadD